MRRRWPRLWAALFFMTLPAWGQGMVLTLDEALKLARDRGTGVALAKGRVEEALARETQAGRRFQENPSVELNGGYRHRRTEGDFLDFEAMLSQGLYAGPQRSARVMGARASTDRARAELADVQRLVLRDVWSVFARILTAQDRMVLLTKSRQAADALLAATQRRFEAGEGTALELNRARVAAVNAQAEQQAEVAAGNVALAHLKGLLGLDVPVEIRGHLASLPPLSLETLLSGISRRPDLDALAAEVREAEAQILLGQALARPGIGIRGGVAREEEAGIVRAGIVLTIPVHDRGRETVAVGQARAASLRLALASAQAAAKAEVRGKYSALTLQLAAARELETTAMPALEDNESLALKSFEAGEIGLGELLLIRREVLETRLTYLDRLLEAALMRFELETAAGALP
jgi:cobalt-zinc-cadmium efflux system outer membrane protein